MRKFFAAARCALLAAGGFTALPAAAQTAVPAAPAPTPAAAAASAAGAAPAANVSERVRQQAERPYYWIRLQSQRAPTAAARDRNTRLRADEPPPAAAILSPAPTPPGARPVAPPVADGRPAETRVTPAPTTPVPLTASAPNLAKDAAASPPGPTRLDQALAELSQAPPAAGKAAAAAADEMPPPPVTEATAARQAAAVEPDGTNRQTATGNAGDAATDSAKAAAPQSAQPPPVEPALAALARTATPPPAPALASPPADEPLALVLQVDPAFPAAWMQRLRKGQVEVRFDVAPDGQVVSASIVRSSHRRLEEAALEAVRAWRFAPIAAPREAVVNLGFDLDS